MNKEMMKKLEEKVAEITMFLENSSEEEKIGRVITLSAKAENEDTNALLDLALLGFVAEETEWVRSKSKHTLKSVRELQQCCYMDGMKNQWYLI